MAEAQHLAMFEQAQQDLDSLGAQEASARLDLETLEAQAREHNGIVMQLTTERKRRFQAAIEDLHVLTTSGELHGDALVNAVEALAAHSPDEWQSRNVQEAKVFGASLRPGSVLCNFNAYGLPIICNLLNDPEAEPPRPVLLGRSGVRTDDLKLGYEITVKSTTKPEPQTVVATPDNWLIGKEAVVEKLESQILGTGLRDASSIQKADFSVRALNYLGAIEVVSKNALDAITHSAVRLYQDLLRRRSSGNELDMLTTYLYEHALDELEKIYDETAAIWASKDLAGAFQDHMNFLESYVRTAPGYYGEGVTLHKQNDLLLTAMQKFTARGRELLAEHDATQAAEA